MKTIKLKYVLIVLVNCILLLGFSFTSVGQNVKTTKPIVISGIVSDEFLKEYLIDQPYVAFYDHYNENFPEGKQIVPINMNGNKFSVKFSPKNHICYFSIGIGTIKALGLGNVFLIIEGDSVEMNIKDTYHVQFSGRGGDNLSYQHWGGNFIQQQFQNSSSGISEPEIVGNYKQLACAAFAIVMDSINKLSCKADPKIFNVLKMNTAYTIKFYLMESIISNRWGCDSTYFDLLKKEMDYIYSEGNAFLDTDPYVVENSYMYTKYLVDLGSVMNQLNTRLVTPPFINQYNQIKKNYSGALRDNLLANFFLTAFRYSPDAVNYLKETKKIISDSVARLYISKIADNNTPGSKAFNFFVKGVKGEPIRLNDFKGKILVVDTWYNGCMFCIFLAKGLEPIEKYFKQRKDVVFLSLDAVDKDRKKFIAGVKSGKYGSDQCIYAWTDGIGDLHPMILHYQYTSYPNLLVIGKDGNVISSNPVKPLDQKSQTEFIKLIKKNL